MNKWKLGSTLDLTSRNPMWWSKWRWWRSIMCSGGVGESNWPNKFVTSIGDEVDDLTRTLDIEEITTEFDENKVENDDRNCTRGRFAKNLVMGEHERSGHGYSTYLGVEILLQTSVNGGEKNVGDDRHDYEGLRQRTGKGRRSSGPGI